MELPDLLKDFFPNGHSITVNDWLVSGDAVLDGGTVSVLGTTNHAFIGAAEALVVSDKLIAISEQYPGRPIVMLVDNRGQRMALNEELLVLPEYVAHLLKAQQLARLNGSKLIAILYGPAIAGGFIAFGMLADRIIAVPGAEPSVMALEAISRVTKMPLEKLEALAKTVSVFAPGCDNFFKMGGVYEIWNDNFNGRLQQLLKSDVSQDLRSRLGQARGGRTSAQDVIDEVLRA
ncbi:MAG: biotin-independent malonate decarboxylase subunit gamma [Terrimicrobiaceae bacterium]